MNQGEGQRQCTQQVGRLLNALVCIRTSIFTVRGIDQNPLAFLCLAHDSPIDMASNGEIRIDQAKRGYDVAEDSQGQLMWYNPFYMKYAPDEEGNFNGQTGYGYISFEKFVDAVTAFKEGKATLDELDRRGLPTLRNTIATTAILEAGRKSLDELRSVEITQEDGGWRLR